MSRRVALFHALRLHESASAREEADRCAMLRLLQELDEPLDRTQERAHFTASALVVDEAGTRTCLVQHAKLGRLLQPGGHIEANDVSVEAAAWREAYEETGVELAWHPRASRPFDLDAHLIPARPGEPAHMHLDVRFLLVGLGDPTVADAAWYPLGEAGDGSVLRLAAKARALAQ
jgi:8-oxo-dGTP pyrophosphatase MutT (NUDIX family)